ncbi:MAG: M61 family metallopeptidase [Aestuariibacter sp.]
MSHQESDCPIFFQVEVDAITTHTYSVQLAVARSGTNILTLSFPSWIPGSYMIRDFAKNIIHMEAQNSAGEPLTLSKIDKQTYQIDNCDDLTTITYQVYAFDLSVRAAFLDKEFGFINGTSLFPHIAELQDSPIQVKFSPVESMPGWQLYTTMPALFASSHGYGLYKVPDYQTLIEHPVLFAQANRVNFEVNDIEFELIMAGGHDADMTRIQNDLYKLVEHHFNLFGNDLGIERYQFQTMLTEEDFGGLEHTHSTALMFSRHDLPTLAQRQQVPDGYKLFLSLCSHEFFHTWHVKRIKPEVLVSPDLSSEVYTRQLWIFEGFTSYYDDFSLQRTGILSSVEYLEILGQNLTRLKRNPGQFMQSVAESSFDAWTKFYKQDENAANAIVSYYTKGAIIGLCLDLKIRLVSEHKYCLDDVMRCLWEKYGKTGIGTRDHVVHDILRNELAIPMDEFVDSLINERGELPTETLLSEFGVELHSRASKGKEDKGGTPCDKAATRDLGADYQITPEGYKIQRVINGRAAQKAGLQKGDVLIALNGWRLNGKPLESLLEREAEHSTVCFTLFRRGRLMDQSFRVEPAEADTVYLTISDIEKSQKWLKPCVD